MNYTDFLAGISGGVTATFLFHPLDLLKIKLAVNSGPSAVPEYSSLRLAVRTILQNDGVPGLYRGVVPSMCGTGMTWGFFLMFYRFIKSSIQQENPDEPLGAKKHVITALQSGVLTLLVVNPVWVIKTRLCAQNELQLNCATSKETCYYGMWDAFKKTYNYEGLRGFYRGFVPSLCGVSTGAVQFMTYEEIKVLYNIYKHSPGNDKLSSSEYLTIAVFSKAFVSVVMYPYQVVRARLQFQHGHYKGSWDCIEKAWRYEGIGGFYKGFVPYLLHALPTICFFFVTYEMVSERSY